MRRTSSIETAEQRKFLTAQGCDVVTRVKATSSVAGQRRRLTELLSGALTERDRRTGAATMLRLTPRTAASLSELWPELGDAADQAAR